MMSFSVDMRDAIVGLAFSRKFPSFSPATPPSYALTSADAWLWVPTAILVSLLECRRQLRFLRPNEDAVQVCEGILLPQGS